MYKEKIIENIKLLSQQDIDFLSKINPRLVGFIHSKDGVIDFIPEDSIRIEWEYLNGYLGQSFRSKLRTAKNYFTEPDRLLKTSSMMIDRRESSRTRRVFELFKEAIEDNSATPVMLVFCLKTIDRYESSKNLFEGHMNKPVFNVGQIVQLRANTGVDAMIEKQRYSYYGCGHMALQKAKKKTFMVLSSDPTIEGRVRAKRYSHDKKQGGCRYYKLLPIGETETYLVTEKFLKVCRTQAVKDARK